MTLTTEQLKERDDDIARQRYENHVVKRASNNGVLTEDSMGFGWRANKPLPEPGDTVRVYGGFGEEIRGVDVNGLPVWYDTQAERDARHAQWRAELHAKRQAELDAERADRDRRIEALPPALRQRMLDLIAAGGEKWRRDNESYELFVCEQAVVIASLGTDEAILRWNSINSASPPDGYKPYDYQRQAEELPGYDTGHSGNTHSVAVWMARGLLRDADEALVSAPAAMSPLTGDPRYP